MELPRASVCSRSTGRLRVRIASRKGDPEFFRRVEDQMSKVRSLRRVAANALTGSVLFEGDGLSAGAIAEHARAHGLFDFAPGPSEPVPLMGRVLPPVRAVDRTLLDITGGTVDLPSGIFLTLVATGLYQILRGQFRVPPWYTAFWYAFGLLTMFVVKKSVQNGSVESSD